MRRIGDVVAHAHLRGIVWRIDEYYVLRELGRGGMGVVYQVAHRPTGRLAALKEILPDVAMSDEANSAFKREMNVMAELIHPNLARFYDHGDHDGRYYFVSELLPGGDVDHVVTQEFGGPVDPAVACRLTCQILDGLACMHEKGFVHRDLKPGNFLVSDAARKPGCVAKISDYGLAKSYVAAGGSSLTKPGQYAGTLMFMAPEQILEYRFVKPPADVYAVGVSLYYLLTGKYTVDFPSPLDQLMQALAEKKRPRDPIEYIMDDPPIAILKRKKDLPRALAKVVDKSVQKDVARRYQSAGEFKAELERMM